MNAVAHRVGPCAVLLLAAALVGCGRGPVEDEPEAAAPRARAASTQRTPRDRPADVLVTRVESDDEAPANLKNEDPNLDLDVPKVDPGLSTKDDIGVPNTSLEDTNPRLNGGRQDPKPDDRPMPFAGRSGALKEKQLREGGGNADSELAVARGLSWLSKQQKADGSWEFDGSAKPDRIAATAMALLPFLAAGETHLNGKRYKQTVLKGLEYLVKNIDAKTGKFAGSPTPFAYSHALGAMALCEAYGMTKDRAFLLAPAQASINYIVNGQGPDGGWRYAPLMAGDTSVTAWMVQALHVARLSKDIAIPEKSFTNIERFLDAMSGGEGTRRATYGYTAGPGAPGTSMTAAGLLCRRYVSMWGENNGGMAEGVEGLLKNAPKFGSKDRPTPLANARNDIYFYYYATQVVFHFGGKEWSEWNEGPIVDGKRSSGMRDWLCALQLKGQSANIGSWEADRGSIGNSCGRLGTTCLCILNLEIYYRHFVPAKPKLRDPLDDK